jgi:Xaa-Pro aminopeptidase
MKEAGFDALLLTKPANMFYLAGDSRPGAYAMIARDGKVALGVPQTDREDVKQLAHFDHILGFENEAGMVSSIAYHFEHFGIRRGVVGLEYNFLTQSMINIAHGLPTSRKLQSGDLVVIDLHPIVDSYSADICRTVCVGKPSAEQQAAYDTYLKAQQTTIAKARTGVGMVELEETLHYMLGGAGHGEPIFGPSIHGVGIEFEEAPLPARSAIFYGEKKPQPLDTNVVIAVGNCGLYTGPWSIRVEDTVVVRPGGGQVLTDYPRQLAK